MEREMMKTEETAKWGGVMEEEGNLKNEVFEKKIGDI